MIFGIYGGERERRGWKALGDACEEGEVGFQWRPGEGTVETDAHGRGRCHD